LSLQAFSAAGSLELSLKKLGIFALASPGTAPAGMSEKAKNATDAHSITEPFMGYLRMSANRTVISRYDWGDCLTA
jgi:hypothetical protein